MVWCNARGNRNAIVSWSGILYHKLRPDPMPQPTPSSTACFQAKWAVIALYKRLGNPHAFISPTPFINARCMPSERAYSASWALLLVKPPLSRLLMVDRPTPYLRARSRRLVPFFLGVPSVLAAILALLGSRALIVTNVDGIRRCGTAGGSNVGFYVHEGYGVSRNQKAMSETISGFGASHIS
jgi:hypothetical protein